jgi:hypothetical protein
MIEVFKTNVTQPATADKIISELNQLVPSAKVNFDLEDCDNILRIDAESENLLPVITDYFQSTGYWCELLK